MTLIPLRQDGGSVKAKCPLWCPRRLSLFLQAQWSDLFVSRHFSRTNLPGWCGMQHSHLSPSHHGALLGQVVTDRSWEHTAESCQARPVGALGFNLCWALLTRCGLLPCRGNADLFDLTLEEVTVRLFASALYTIQLTIKRG
jgi:hypothetical protein